MKFFGKYIAFLVLLFAPLSAFCQDLPSIAKASEINTGTFSNGVSYYIVSNGTSKGYAEFALVQRGALSVKAARESLADLPHFVGKSPCEYLASKGVGYSSEGFATISAEGTVFRFRGVPVYDKSVCDSTILLITDLISTYGKDQALVISGDIDVKYIKDRLEIFLLSVNPRVKQQRGLNYEWRPKEHLSYEFETNRTDNVGLITFTYAAQRTPFERMNTPVPLVSRLFAMEIGYIINDRVKQSFSKVDIPLGGISFDYRGGESSGGDESYTFSVAVSADKMVPAASRLAAMLSDLDRIGVSPAEFKYAKNMAMTEFARAAGMEVLTNSQYVDKCVASYLYGTNLASATSINDFFARRGIPEDRELILFRNFVSAILDAQRNLTITYSLPRGNFDREALVDAFDRSWNAPAQPGARRDTISFDESLIRYLGSNYEPRNSKIKIKGETDEPVTGGKLWTFSNGIKVVYKKAPTKGEFNYAFMLKGGFATVEGLAPGESAFVGDMLKISDVAGSTGREFRRSLAAKGITMDYQASLTDLRITGSAPVQSLPLLLQALAAMADDREPNDIEFEYYRQCEYLREQLSEHTQQGIYEVMDSLICPDNFYSSRRQTKNIGDRLPERAEKYFADRFSNFGDGLIVLIGDLDYYKVQEVLCKYLGQFPTSKKYSMRPRFKYGQHSGLSTYTVDSKAAYVGTGEPCVNVSLNTLSPLTFEKYIAFRIARVAIEKELVGELQSRGVYAEVSGDVMIFPAEKYTIYITCRQCNVDGLPAGVEPADPLGTLSAIRSALGHLVSTDITNAELKAYKEELLHEMSSEFARPEHMVETVLTRYAEGKNLGSGYEKHINGLTVDSVKQMLKELAGGGRIEYIIK